MSDNKETSRDWRTGKHALNVRIRGAEKIALVEKYMNQFNGSQQLALDAIITLALGATGNEALTALSAERDALKQKVAELEKGSNKDSSKQLREYQEEIRILKQELKIVSHGANGNADIIAKQREEIKQLKNANVSPLAEPAIEKALAAIKSKKNLGTDQEVIRYALTYVLKNDWL